MYDRSEAAMRRIAAKAREGGEVCQAYLRLARFMMRSFPPSQLRDRALARLADSCDDVMPLEEKRTQSARKSPHDPPSPGPTGR